ncbi:3-phosphoserine phosphatase [Artemisia annua]|uniref:3-phosphoserine phosphatase n=1 Tax=Artemisia annua TaxID=35608 RepID=A0A2U1KYD2_ARTAN|nr:3-phosphoserine phosphatase [Artemisia annua]
MRSSACPENTSVTSRQSTAFLLDRFDNSLPQKGSLDLWQKVGVVCFDVNSTVCIDKGIHELGEFCGAAKPVGEWTARYCLWLYVTAKSLAFPLSCRLPILKGEKWWQGFLDDARSTRVNEGALAFDQNKGVEGLGQQFWRMFEYNQTVHIG